MNTYRLLARTSLSLPLMVADLLYVDLVLVEVDVWLSVKGFSDRGT